MEKDFYYLSYYQVMSLMYAIAQFRKRNPYFSDEITNTFEKYVVNRTYEISMCSSIKSKFKFDANKYIVSKSMIEYLIRLTDVNILDKTVLKKYIKLVKEFEHNLEVKALNGLLENEEHKKL